MYTYSFILQAGRSGDKILVEAQIFCAHPPSLLYSRYWVSSLALKQPGHGIDHPPHLALRLKKEQCYNFTPILSLHGLFWEELLPLPLHSVYLISHCPHTDQILPELPAPHKSLTWPVLVCFIRHCDIGGFWCIISVETLDLYFYQRQYIQTDTLN